MSLIVPLTFLLAQIATLTALWTVHSRLLMLKSVVEKLDSEAERIETRRFELESELDARIKRLLARETYWKGVATERRSSTDAADVVDPGEARSASAPSGESTLSLKQRLGRVG